MTAPPPDWLLVDDPDVLLRVKAVPGASRDAIAGALGDRLKVRTSAPPEGGRANRAIEALLARTIGVPASAVSVERGHGAAAKTIRVRDVEPRRVAEALA